MFSEVFDLKPTRTDRISTIGAGKAANCPEGTLEISPPEAGASHRFVANIDPSPGWGGGNRTTTIASPLPGLASFCVRNRWLAPPANVHDASGVLAL